MCINFSTESHFTFFFVNGYMSVMVSITHPPMVSVIVVYKNKATNAASKLL